MKSSKHTIVEASEAPRFQVLRDGEVVARAYTLRDARSMQRHLNAGTADPRLLNAPTAH